MNTCNIQICIHGHPIKRHLARKWGIHCLHNQKGTAKIKTNKDLQDDRYHPIEHVKAIARRQACHLVKELIGRDPYDSEINWTFRFLRLDQPWELIKTHEKVPTIIYIARLQHGQITGPFKLRFNPALGYWIADTPKGQSMAESAIGIGEIVRVCANNKTARFAHPSRVAVESWIQGAKTSLLLTGNHVVEIRDEK